MRSASKWRLAGIGKGIEEEEKEIKTKKKEKKKE